MALLRETFRRGDEGYLRAKGEAPMARRSSLDEMWTYEGVRKGPKRRSVWIWTAVIEWPDGRRFFDYEVGDRSTATFYRLFDRLPAAHQYFTDRYEVYAELPTDRHQVGKGGPVNWNEGRHSCLRDRLHRLRRQTKGYTKSVEMLHASIALVALYLGWF